MPIFEYTCKSCGNQFELLVRGEMVPACPACQSQELEKVFGLPAIKSSGTRDLSMRAAKKRDQGQAAERMYTQMQYEQSHDRHG